MRTLCLLLMLSVGCANESPSVVGVALPSVTGPAAGRSAVAEAPSVPVARTALLHRGAPHLVGVPPEGDVVAVIEDQTLEVFDDRGNLLLATPAPANRPCVAPGNGVYWVDAHALVGWWPSRHTSALALGLTENAYLQTTDDGAWIAFDDDGGIAFGPRDGMLEHAPATGSFRIAPATGHLFFSQQLNDGTGVVRIPRGERLASAATVCSKCGMSDISLDGLTLLTERWRTDGQRVLGVSSTAAPDAPAMLSGHLPLWGNGCYLGARFQPWRDRAVMFIGDCHSDNYAYVWDLTMNQIAPTPECGDYNPTITVTTNAIRCSSCCSSSCSSREVDRVLPDGRRIVASSTIKYHQGQCDHVDPRWLSVEVAGMAINLANGTHMPATWADDVRLVYTRDPNDQLVVADVTRSPVIPGAIDDHVTEIAVDTRHQRVFYVVAGDGDRDGLYLRYLPTSP